jgi:hypothetical protein
MWAPSRTVFVISSWIQPQMNTDSEDQALVLHPAFTEIQKHPDIKTGSLQFI